MALPHSEFDKKVENDYPHKKRKRHKKRHKERELTEEELRAEIEAWYDRRPYYKSHDEDEVEENTVAEEPEEKGKYNIFTGKGDNNIEAAYCNVAMAIMFPAAVVSVFNLLVIGLGIVSIYLKLHEWCLGENFCGEPAVNVVIFMSLLVIDIGVVIAVFKSYGYQAWQIIGFLLFFPSMAFKLPFWGITGVIMIIIGAICKVCAWKREGKI